MEKKRIVVKIGSSSLINGEGGLCMMKLGEHVGALVRLKKCGHEVILVSSGAVAAGLTDLGYLSRPSTIEGKQAAAAVGQGLLLQGYTEELKKHKVVAAQMLLTKQNILYQEQSKNAKATLCELLKRDVMPVINENDSVSIEGLTFGDNDMLSALVSCLVQADFLMILTDINGIYKDNPRTNPDAQRYDVLHNIPDELVNATSSEGSLVGTGGMKSKIEAARTAFVSGVPVFIGSGHGDKKLVDILAGKGDGTYIENLPEPAVGNFKQHLDFNNLVR